MSGVLHGVLASLKAAAAAVTDAFFEYVSLLLNTSATNGAQNNTFLDSSTNAFSITRNGNTTQGTFSPFSQTGWSNYFDGTGDYLSVAHNAALNLTSGDFTIEAFVYWSGSNANSTIIDKDGVSGSSYPQYDISLNGSGFVVCYVGSGNGTSSIQSITSNTALPANTWAHLAFVKSGTTLTLYQNGTSVASATQTATMTDGAKAVLVGYQTGVASTYYFNGYISNARIVKGTAVYTANFTPPTAPLTAITNTSLLTCQSNRFIDNSSNAFAITRNGDVSVQAFSPFNPTAAYSSSTNGGSGYFDGTGDYLSVADNTALDPGTGDFCLEVWVYFNALSIGNIYNGQQQGISLTLNGSNQFSFGQSYVVDLLADTVAAVTGQWYHVAVCRSGTTLSLFVNGSRRATTTNSTNFNTNSVNYIGWNGGAAYVNGYLSNLRLVKGTAVYDPTLTTLTVPTAPLTAITNTSLLLNFTNAGIYDSASGNDLETVGNAQVSTVQAKWGTTSMAFDGTGDWLTAIDRPALRFGAAPFTIEFWVFRSALATQGFVSKRNATPTGWFVGGNASNKLEFRADATVIASTASILGGQWYHIAVVREGTGTNQTKLYIDGVNDGTGTIANNFTNTDVLFVGADQSGASPFTGYIDDLRITNGYARYTANFTPPTAAFPLN